MIDIFTSEDMENISVCIFQYLTLYYIIKIIIMQYCIWIYEKVNLPNLFALLLISEKATEMIILNRNIEDQNEKSPDDLSDICANKQNLTAYNKE